MNSDQWARIKEIFQLALDLPSAERAAFVREASCGDEDLRAEVQSLLDAEPGDDDFLSGSAADYVPDAVADQAAGDRNLGRHIGPYRLVRELGAGGMGAVYLAERTGDFHQTVAVKLMHAGLYSRSVTSRFRHERQILASLDHANIAKLFDGGATEDGQPYFVMEYVEGQPIDQWCAERMPALPEVLSLFLQVCSAVQYAHQNLVVHRDLKPGNILVTAEGTPKLLDFGIAKLLRPDETGEALTQAGMRLMTPEYASPEQVRGLPVSTASDVYSLGVILYHLLAGGPPYSFESDSPGEIERVVTTREPVKPSEAAEPGFRERLAGDLDVIVLRALEKEPQRRYTSVEQFAGDIRRYLEGQPILARPQTLGYRTSRFVRRNRLAVAAALLVAMSLAVGLMVSLWQARIARLERARAERNFNDVRHLTQSFLFDFHDKIKDLPGSTEARNAVVQTAVDYLRRLSQEAKGNDPLARDVAEAYLRLGDVQGNPYGSNQGDIEAALASYGQAAAIAEDLVKRSPQDPDARLYAARAERAIGETLPQQGQVAEAVPHFRSAIRLLDGWTSQAAKLETAKNYEMLGDVLGHEGLTNLGDPAGARASYQSSLSLHESLGLKRSIAVLRMKLGDLDMDAGSASTALANFQSAATVFQELSAAAPLNTGAQREAAMIHGKIGDAWDALGKPDNAAAEYDQASGISKRLMEADPKNDQARMDYAVRLKGRADRLSKHADYRSALPLYREVLGLLASMSAAHPQNLLLKGRQAGMLISIGYLLAKLHQDAEGRRLYAEGLRMVKELADRPSATAGELNDYVEDLVDAPFPDLAVQADAVRYAKRAVETSTGAVPRYMDRWAAALFNDGKTAEAVAVQEKAVAGMPQGSPDRRGAEERLDRYRTAAEKAKKKL